jgi:hypothetical protein
MVLRMEPGLQYCSTTSDKLPDKNGGSAHVGSKYIFDRGLRPSGIKRVVGEAIAA